MSIFREISEIKIPIILDRMVHCKDSGFVACWSFSSKILIVDLNTGIKYKQNWKDRQYTKIRFVWDLGGGGFLCRIEYEFRGGQVNELYLLSVSEGVLSRTEVVDERLARDLYRLNSRDNYFVSRAPLEPNKPYFFYHFEFIRGSLNIDYFNLEDDSWRVGHWRPGGCDFVAHRTCSSTGLSEFRIYRLRPENLKRGIEGYHTLNFNSSLRPVLFPVCEDSLLCGVFDIKDPEHSDFDDPTSESKVAVINWEGEALQWLDGSLGEDPELKYSGHHRWHFWNGSVCVQFSKGDVRSGENRRVIKTYDIESGRFLGEYIFPEVVGLIKYFSGQIMTMQEIPGKKSRTEMFMHLNDMETFKETLTAGPFTSLPVVSNGVCAIRKASASPTSFTFYALCGHEFGSLEALTE